MRDVLAIDVLDLNHSRMHHIHLKVEEFDLVGERTKAKRNGLLGSTSNGKFG